MPSTDFQVTVFTTTTLDKDFPTVVFQRKQQFHYDEYVSAWVEYRPHSQQYQVFGNSNYFGMSEPQYVNQDGDYAWYKGYHCSLEDSIAECEKLFQHMKIKVERVVEMLSVR